MTYVVTEEDNKTQYFHVLSFISLAYCSISVCTSTQVHPLVKYLKGNFFEHLSITRTESTRKFRLSKSGSRASCDVGCKECTTHVTRILMILFSGGFYMKHLSCVELRFSPPSSPRDSDQTECHSKQLIMLI